MRLAEKATNLLLISAITVPPHKNILNIIEQKVEKVNSISQSFLPIIKKKQRRKLYE